ncbi:TonB-dependent receptor [soil metagenome]
MKCNYKTVGSAVVLLLLLLTNPFFLNAQNINISGKITDASGNGLDGVTILVKGTGASTITNEQGNFSLSGVNPTAIFTFSHVGYEGQEIKVNNRTVINLTMALTQKVMEDVVIIGYGTQKKKNVTGAVSSFDARKLDERPLTRVDQALVGQLAGVQVKQTSGSLGKGFSIQVRGSGSISAGNEPLYVIDGFPLATTSPNGSGNYGSGNPLDNINPNDLESVQVLKDASAAAIYGSRAANGVVLITTKKGQSGKAKINLNVYGGYMERSRKLDMLSPEEWVDRATEIINAQWVASAPGRTASQTNEERRIILGLAPGNVNTGFMTDDRWAMPGHPGLNYIDWQDAAFRKGNTQNIQLSASGGTDIVKYYASGNYMKQDGMVINTDYTSYSARVNLEVNASKKLKFGVNISPSYSINNDPGVEGKDNILHQMISYSPVQEDTMGLLSNVGNNGQYRWSNSPNSNIGKLQSTVGQTKRFGTIASVFGEYQIIKGLNFKTTVNLDNTDNNTNSYVPYTIGSSSVSARLSQLTALTSGVYTSYRRQTFVNENTLNYNKTINDVHDISILAGQSYNTNRLDAVRLASQGGFRGNSIQTLSDANAVTGTTTGTKDVLISYFGRLQYGFNGKYLLSASLRRDGSSRFGANTKWGTFPSASIGWRIIQENFMNALPVVSDLKLRASWGKSGNNNIPDYGSIATLGTYNYSFNGTGVVGQAPSGIANPDITWEKSETFDVGLDFGFLNNRITASIDYYNKFNTELLLNVPVLGVTGFNTALSNAGKVRNKGWELEVTSRNVTGKLEWSTSVNLSHNANKVVELAGGQDQILIPSAFDISHSLLKIGQPIYSIYVVKQIGILSADDIAKNVAIYGSEKEGDPKYLDANNDGVIDANDRVIVGKPNASYTWGITNTVRFKGFDLSVLVQGQNGGSIYSLLGRAINRTGQGFTDNALGYYRDRWRSAADPGAGTVGKVYSTFGRIKNTDWLYSSNYVRVRNITAGYNLGKLFNTKYVQAARIYLTLENFFGKDKYLGGFNPEANNTDVSGNSAFPEAGDYGGLPLPKSLIFGVNFTF